PRRCRARAACRCARAPPRREDSRYRAACQGPNLAFREAAPNIACGRRPARTVVPHAPRYAIIMAGGAGTRFWPRSRVHTPKQLLALRGGRSLLQETVARVSPPIRRDRVLVVTGRAHARAVARQLARRGRGALLVEPEGRNTAAAIALAALHVARRAPEAVLAVLPADHVIDDLPAFRRDLRLALEVAEQSGALVTIGVPPTHAETGYGYIRLGAALPGSHGQGAWAAEFIEKRERAARAATCSGTRASSRGGRAPSWLRCACTSPR